jgi:hypothetical protein
MAFYLNSYRRFLKSRHRIVKIRVDNDRSKDKVSPDHDSDLVKAKPGVEGLRLECLRLIIVSL